MQFKIFGCKVNKYYTDEWLKSEYLKDKEGVFVASCVVTDKAKRKWIKFVKDTARELGQTPPSNSPLSKGGENETSLISKGVKNKIPLLAKEGLGEVGKKQKIFISGCGAFKKGEAQEDFFDIYPELKEFRDIIVILGEKPDELKREIDENKKETSSLLPPSNSPLSKGGETEIPLLKGERNNKENSLNDSESSSEGYNKNSLSSKGEGIQGGGIIKLKKLPQIYTKKFLLIQGGCDSFCSFCLTVQKRGRHYFRNKDDIVAEINEFDKNGGKEVVLTGVNLSAWGLHSTNPPEILSAGNNPTFTKFAELIDFILKNTSIPRIRISSMGPEFIDARCLELFTNTRIYPHFHYSVQSGSSNILKAMRRHYDGKYMREILEKTKNLQRTDGVEVSVGADLIVGFPGESETDFLDTYNLVADGLITKIHAFPFSAHDFGESVPAGKYDSQIDEAIKKERMWALEEIGDKVRDEFIERNIGKKFKVLIEVVKTPPPLSEVSPSMRGTKREVKWKGWTENYIEASEKTFEILEGKIEKNSIVVGILK